MLFGGALAGGVTAAGSHVHLSLVGVVLAGLAGNLVGSWVAYGVGRAGGRPLLDRYGKYFLLRKGELDRAEVFFARRGQWAVFFGRMIPLVRAFVSLPAGIAGMPVTSFTVLTLLGSIPWTIALALAGDALASHWKSVSNAFTPISIVLAVIVVGWLAWWAFGRLRAGPGPADAELMTTEEPGPVSTAAPVERP
jgi:membrane protein DedA with SNARE-associated domain